MTTVVPTPMEHVRRRLTPRQYRVAIMRYGRGLSQYEIARRLGVIRPAVQNHIRLIVRKFPSLSPS